MLAAHVGTQNQHCCFFFSNVVLVAEHGKSMYVDLQLCIVLPNNFPEKVTLELIQIVMITLINSKTLLNRFLFPVWRNPSIHMRWDKQFIDCTIQINTALFFAYALTQELHLNENLIPSNEERCASLQNENESSGHGKTLAKMHCFLWDCFIHSHGYWWNRTVHSCAAPKWVRLI